MSASFEEKTVWATLAGLGLSLALYLYLALPMLLGGEMEVAPYLPVLAIAIASFAVVVAVSAAAAALMGSDEGRDERDRLISWRAEHHSAWLLTVGVLAAIGALLIPLEPAWVANGLLASLYLAELFNELLKLYFYRRGI